jgi:ABC-type uncharacterized transport system substrate-binding protein
VKVGAIGAVVALMLGALAPVAAAQPRSPTPARVGDLALSWAIGPPEPPAEYWDALREALRRHGYVEGRNVVFERRDARDRPDLLPAAAAELVREGVDVILARGAQAVRAAMRATRTVPIVAMDLDGDSTVVPRPADNVTGVVLDPADLSGKQVELLKELLPKLAALTIVGDPDVHVAYFQAMQREARARSVTVEYLEIRSAQEYGDAFKMTPGNLTGALVVLSSPRLFAFRRDAAGIARERGMPTLFLYPAYVEAGGLAAYGPDLPEVFRRCGDYLGLILAGARPGDLPIARPDRLRLVVGEETARALGVTIPRSLRQRVDRVIE